MAAGELVVGVVYDPRAQEMFAAAKGLGAWLGDQRISVSKVDRLEKRPARDRLRPGSERPGAVVDWWRYFSFKCQSLRRTGSTALNLAYLACGRFDGYWAFDNHAWDVAGGFVLVREAGGTVTRLGRRPGGLLRPGPDRHQRPIHAQMLECLKSSPA